MLLSTTRLVCSYREGIASKFSRYSEIIRPLGLARDTKYQTVREETRQQIFSRCLQNENEFRKPLATCRASFASATLDKSQEGIGFLANRFFESSN
jgi:hypothetical protein